MPQSDTQKEFRSEFKMIKAKFIFADPSYNRPIQVREVQDIIANFNPNIVEPLKVSYRDGKYWIFNGNHTLTALLEMSGHDPELQALCRVYYGMTREDEARLFAEQNGCARKVSSSYKVRALGVAKDKDVLDFANAVEEAGAKCTFKATGAPYHIKCYDTAFKIYQKHGKQHIKNIISIIIKTWKGNPDSLRKEIICGMDILLRAYPDVDLGMLVARLSRTDAPNPSEIIKRGKGDTFFTGNKRYAGQLVNIYNKRLLKSKELPAANILDCPAT